MISLQPGLNNVTMQGGDKHHIVLVLSWITTFCVPVSDLYWMQHNIVYCILFIPNVEILVEITKKPAFM